MLEDIKESSETGSRNSMELYLNPVEDDYLNKVKNELLASENERLRCHNDELLKINEEYLLEIKELERKNDIQRKEFAHNIQTAASRKFLNVKNREEKKLSLERCVSITISKSASRNLNEQSLEVKIKQLQGKNDQLLEENNKLNLEIIRLKEENEAILVEYQNQTTTNYGNFNKFYDWNDKAYKNISHSHRAEYEELKEELEFAKNRNSEMENQLEYLKFHHQNLNRQYEITIPHVTTFYKNLYELYSRKQASLEYQENKILHLYKMLEEEIQEEYTSHNSHSFSLFLLCFAFLISLLGYFYMKSFPTRP